MTPKQVDRIKNKIAKIKKALAADKRRWGGYYDDSRGLRYLPPGYYLKLQDYTGCLRYYNWFMKNFPGDTGYPLFIFEWTIVLFKTRRAHQAENKALETFFANPYLIHSFLGREVDDLDIYEGSNWEMAGLVDEIPYSKSQEELADFVSWLEYFVDDERFQKFAGEYMEIGRKLKNEPSGPVRTALMKRRGDMRAELRKL